MNNVSKKYQPRFSSIIVVTYGRSGSTLLNGILNSIPGYIIRGENQNFLGGLYQSYLSLRVARDKFGPRENSTPADPWFGADKLLPGRFLEGARGLVIEQLRGDDEMPDVIGFKEVRYFKYRKELPGFLDFLYEIMPNLGLIVLHRDLEKVVNSGWWVASKDPKQVEEKLGLFEEVSRLYVDNKKDRSFLITYEDIIAKTENLEKLFAFLNAKYDLDIINSILSRNHSVSTELFLRKL